MSEGYVSSAPGGPHLQVDPHPEWFRTGDLGMLDHDQNLTYVDRVRAHAGRDTHCPVSWWIARIQRTLTEEITATPDQVRDFYVDLNNIKRVHPLVVAVRSTDRSQTEGGYVHTYRVHDRIPLGPFTLRTSYVARVHVLQAGDVVATCAGEFPGYACTAL